MIRHDSLGFGKLPTCRYVEVSMYGGAPKWDQVNKYRQGVHSIIACPGRLNDLLDGRQVQVSWMFCFQWQLVDVCFRCDA